MMNNIVDEYIDLTIEKMKEGYTLINMTTVLEMLRTIQKEQVK